VRVVDLAQPAVVAPPGIVAVPAYVLIGRVMFTGNPTPDALATVFTEGLRPGRHKLFALLADDQHAPLMPEVATSVTIIVKPGAMGPM
jgi:hypothetical protein